MKNEYLLMVYLGLQLFWTKTFGECTYLLLFRIWRRLHEIVWNSVSKELEIKSVRVVQLYLLLAL